MSASSRVSALIENLRWPQRLEWIFALRTSAAGLIALMLALALGLPEPQWSITAVFIVAQPFAGMVIAKGVYRVVGTVVGAGAALVLVSCLSQHPWLFLLAMTAWMAACTYASTLLRDVQAYGAVLSGYTAALIAFPAMAEPHLLLELAMARSSEITLGILCAGLVNAFVLPRRIRPLMYEQLRLLLAKVAGYCAGALAGHDAATLTVLHRAVIADVGEVDQLRRYAIAEGPVLRGRNRRARHLLAQILAATSAARTLNRHASAIPAEVQPLLRQAAAAFEQLAGSAATLEDAGPWLDQLSEAAAAVSARQAQIAGNDLVSQRAAASLARLAELIESMLGAVSGFQTLLRGQQGPGAAGGTWLNHRDLPQARRNALRVAVPTAVMGLACLLAPSQATVAGVVIVSSMVGLFGNRPDGVALSLAFFWGVVAAVPLAAAYALVLLPMLPGEWPLILALAPVLVLAALAMARPGPIGLGATGLVVFFLALAPPRTTMTVTPKEFFLSAAAAVGGLLLCVFVLKILLPPQPRQEVKGLIAAMRSHVARICTGAAVPARLTFESQMYDRINRLLARRSFIGPEAEAVIDGAMSCLVMGLELIELRKAANGSLAQQRELAILLARLARSLEQGTDRKMIGLHIAESRAIASAIVGADPRPQTLRLAAALRLTALELVDNIGFFSDGPAPARAAA